MIRDMPYTTVEQVLALRDRAMLIELQHHRLKNAIARYNTKLNNLFSDGELAEFISKQTEENIKEIENIFEMEE